MGDFTHHVNPGARGFDCAGPIRRAHEAESGSLGMMRQDTGERIERQPVRNVLRMSELPDKLLFEMVPGSVSSSAL